MIYAIEAVGLDRVKFGKAKNPWSRVKLLATGSPVPLELRIVVPWPDFCEGQIHRAFAEERITGEWFEITKRVKQFCRSMRGKEHYSICSSTDFPKGPGEVIEVAASAGKSRSVETLADMRQGPPLTPAQRQKAYRERGGDELRERERLRMRRKRGG